MSPYGFAEEGTTNVDGVVYAWSESQGRMVAQSGTRRRCLIGQSMMGGSGSAFSGQWTFLNQHSSLVAFGAVILAFRNKSASPMTITSFKLAAAAVDADNGTGLSWISGTISGAAGGTIPASPTSGVDTEDGILLSDPIPLSSLERTDVPGAFPLIQTRVLIASGGALASRNTDVLNASTGFLAKGKAISGDHVTIIDSQTPSATGVYVACDVIFLPKSPTQEGITILGVGDSRERGEYSNSGDFGPVISAMSQSATKTVKVGGLCYGVSGAHRQYSHAELLKLLPILRPTFAHVWMESPNNGSTQAAYDAAFALGRMAIQACLDNGTTPILLTPTPRNATGAALVSWQNCRDSVRALAQRESLPLVDLSATFEDPAIPGAWLSTYKASGDGTNLHGNEASYLKHGAMLLAAMGIA